MFFLARSIFWLGVVFSWIPWSGDDGAAAGPRQAAIGIAGDATSAASRQIASYCLAAPRDCLRAAHTVRGAINIETLLELDAAMPALGKIPSSR